MKPRLSILPVYRLLPVFTHTFIIVGSNQGEFWIVCRVVIHLSSRNSPMGRQTISYFV